ncbi:MULTISPECIES: hypothetical protein [unclassified Nonomuraea]|nr:MULTISPECIES: hypothetical protein [unclassified Nonomuraea]NBE95601.1 hypothetical protein [Nonomuraea sp. K271]
MPALKTPSSIVVMVAGAGNAGVSTVIETFGMRGDTPSIAQVKDLDV